MLAGYWQDFKVQNLSAEEARKLTAPWQALSAHAIEPAGFNAPELALPILKQQSGATLAAVTDGPDLLFALPNENGFGYSKSWVTPLTASGTPHIAENLHAATITAFLSGQSRPFLFQAIAADGACHSALQQHAGRYAVFETWARAGLKISGTYENWLQTNFDQKRRKEFKRLRTRLSEQGNLVSEQLQSSSGVESFASDFLKLEAAGWKGKRGTAIAADVNMAAALRESATDLHKSGKLRFWSLKLDGKCIASLFAIVEKDQAWLGKIAHDENFAKYSPGALIILDCTGSFFADPSIRSVDSSAIPNHPLIDRIWRDRLPMISVFVASAKVSKLKFNFTVMLARQKLKWRNIARDLYYKVKGKRRS